jgi:hypothetical protein
MDPSGDPKVSHWGRCRPTMLRKQVSRPVDGLNPLPWPRRRSRSSELEERPGHGLDPRFLCPTRSDQEHQPLLDLEQQVEKLAMRERLSLVGERTRRHGTPAARPVVPMTITHPARPVSRAAPRFPPAEAGQGTARRHFASPLKDTKRLRPETPSRAPTAAACQADARRSVKTPSTASFRSVE